MDEDNMEIKLEIDQTQLEDAQNKPLFQLMEKLLDEDENTDETLISYDNLTVILKTDFDIDLGSFTKAEVESYMSVLKWSLKGWPGWEQVASEEKGLQLNVISKERVLREYISVKKYISFRLRITRRCIMAIQKNYEKIDENEKDDKLVLKVECGKNKLKYLINSRISRKLKLVNFKIPSLVSAPDQYQCVSFMDIFNLPFLEVYLSLPNFSYVHKNVSKSFYKVIDWKQGNLNKKIKTNDREIYCKNITTRKYGFELSFFMEYLDQVIKFINDSKKMSNTKKNDLAVLFRQIKKDVFVLNDHITIGTEYKHNLSDYNYVQYSRNIVNLNLIKHDDLFKKYEHVQPRLQHTITPAIIFSLSAFSCTYTTDNNGKRTFKLGLDIMEHINNNWLRIHCALCEKSIVGFLSFHELNTHLSDYHGAEEEWQCVKCQNSFNALQLANLRWYHNCTLQDRLAI